MISGIYVIESPTGSQYVGSAVNLRRRRDQHLSALRRNKHRNGRLQLAFSRYGESISFRTLLVCRREDLLFYEQRTIDVYSPGYNICPIAGNCLGVKRSDQSRQKMRAAGLGRKDRPETVEKKRLSLIGRAVSVETRAKLAKQAGWKHSEESRQKMRGRKHSDEILARFSLARLGKPGWWRGKSRSESTRQKIRQTLAGRPRSAESIAKQRATNAAKRLVLQSVDFEIT